MSDFFHNLASRVSGRESVVRPRVAGRYEQSEPTEQFVEISEETEGAAYQRPRAAARRDWSTVASPETGSGERFERLGQGEVQQIYETLERGPSVTRPLAVDQPRPLLLDNSRPGDQAPNQPIREDAERHPSDEELSARHEEQRVQGRISPIMAPNAAPVASTTPPRTTPPRTATPVSVAEHAAPVRERVTVPRAVYGARESSATSETVVHVSIGRIELRAPPAAAPSSQRERSPSPVSTLAEYLRQHAAARSRS